MLYRQRQLQYIFILKSLNTLKISKYRKEISEKVVKYEKRFKWFLFWPLLHIYEIYEDWQANRNRNN
tara:strand:- start:1265 stop:1465 length:201 start_codon:yes stop_codon:yes gene_type:complete